MKIISRCESMTSTKMEKYNHALLDAATWWHNERSNVDGNDWDEHSDQGYRSEHLYDSNTTGYNDELDEEKDGSVNPVVIVHGGEIFMVTTSKLGQIWGQVCLLTKERKGKCNRDNFLGRITEFEASRSDDRRSFCQATLRRFSTSLAGMLLFSKAFSSNFAVSRNPKLTRLRTTQSFLLESDFLQNPDLHWVVGGRGFKRFNLEITQFKWLKMMMFTRFKSRIERKQ